MIIISKRTLPIAMIVLIISTTLLTGCGLVTFKAQYETTLLSPDTVAETTLPTENETTSPERAETVAITEPKPSVELIEDNINAESLSEDQQMTDDALAQNIGETPALVPEINFQNRLKRVPEDGDSIFVTRHYATGIPEMIVENLKYTQYEVAKDYVLITSNGAIIREMPDPSAKKLGSAAYFEKVAVLAEVKGKFSTRTKTDRWYEVVQKKGDQTIHGYLLSSSATLRTFQFQKMFEAITALKKEIDDSATACISNYKNVNGKPPSHQGQSIDAFGIKRHQSAPAYFSDNTKSDFRYIADGTLVSIVGETDDFYKITTLNFTWEYYVPKRYVSLENSINQLTKVIVVDRKNQNEGVFEYADNRWNMISYIYATTGEKARYKEPTALGYYMAIQKVDKFLYLDDVTKQIAGYAPYAIRFGGGAYVHGVPVDLRIVNGVKIYPPRKEYLFTIGTMPRSHKCVRNYTSHAKFLHTWCDIGSTAVVVIE